MEEKQEGLVVRNDPGVTFMPTPIQGISFVTNGRFHYNVLRVTSLARVGTTLKAPAVNTAFMHHHSRHNVMITAILVSGIRAKYGKLCGNELVNVGS